MYCRHCGKQIKDEALFCTYCGQAVKKTAPSVDNTAKTPAGAQVQTPVGEQVEKPKKQNKLVAILISVIALLVVVIIAVGAYFVLGNRDDSESRRTTWEDDEDSDRDDDGDDEDADEREDGTESSVESTEESATAAATAGELDMTQLYGLIETLCWNGSPIQSILEDPAEFCNFFIMSSIRDVTVEQRILEMYPDAYQKDYYLCMTEDDVQDYLTNSIGLGEMSALYEAASYEGYSSYEDGVFTMVGWDTGDYWVDEPMITEVRQVSDTEIVVSGEIKNGTGPNSKTSFFEITMAANPDSIWSGYTLTAITRWDTYILPYVDSTYLTQTDIMNLDEEYLRLARNEIYARHGRMFDDEGLQNYFGTCSWYVGTIPASEFDDTLLNEYELANRDLIVQYEQQLKNNN